jgi:Mrp family chromosome partitioning ATPase
MVALLMYLRENFDSIIIDAPPLLPVTDAAVPTCSVDGAIVVTWHGFTHRPGTKGDRG